VLSLQVVSWHPNRMPATHSAFLKLRELSLSACTKSMLEVNP
jgi:hypothetical protein